MLFLLVYEDYRLPVNEFEPICEFGIGFLHYLRGLREVEADFDEILLREFEFLSPREVARLKHVGHNLFEVFL